MAAILEPHRLPTSFAPRPELRLVQGGGGVRPADRPLVSPAAAVAFVVVTLLLMIGAVALGHGAFSAAAPAAPSRATAASAPAGSPAVTVQAGDTLWSIARRLQPTGDVRSLVDRLAAANGGTAIAPGDRIAIPS